MKNLSVTCIGAGVIGSGWAARLLVNGINVNVFDKRPESYNRTRLSVERAKKYFSQLTKAPLREMGSLTFDKSLEDAVKGTSLKIEITSKERCNGHWHTCSYCGGAGVIRQQQGFFSMQQTCPHCRGEGEIHDLSLIHI